MILADTSIWIDHFRKADDELQKIIEDDRLLCHPFVIGELALGSLQNREAVIEHLSVQRSAIVATHEEVIGLITRHAIFNMGIGYIDAHLLASTLLDPIAALWTRDRRLATAAVKSGARLHEPVTRLS